MMRFWIDLLLLLALVGLLSAARCEPAANTNSTPGQMLVFLGPVHELTALTSSGYTVGSDGEVTVTIYEHQPDPVNKQTTHLIPYHGQLGEQPVTTRCIN